MSQFTISLENQLNNETYLGFIGSLNSLKETAIRLYNLRNAAFLYEDKEGNSFPLENALDFDSLIEASKGKPIVKLIAKRKTNFKKESCISEETETEDFNNENFTETDTRKSKRINLKLRKGKGNINSGYSRHEMERIENIKIKKELQRHANDENYKLRINKILLYNQSNKNEKNKGNSNKKNREMSLI